MSKKIGIVSEGVSDYYVLKHIVSRYLKEQDVYTIPLNSKQAKGKQVGFSGWQGVLNYISGTDEKNLFVEALKVFLLASIAMQNVAVCGIRTGYDLAT